MIAYLNGKIYTAEPENLWTEAVIVKENKIEFVGSTEEVKKRLNDKDEIIDLDGKLMLPGFIDSHLHLMIGGFQLINIDMDKVRSKNEFREEIKKYISENNLKWVTGGNWDHERFKEKTLPTKEWIDDITPDIPVFVTRRDLHMGLANSKAMELAGIDKNTPNPEGGLIMKNSNGELTGILKDTAMNFINKIIPEVTEEKDYKALDAALGEFKKLGITSVHDISRKNDFNLYKNYLDNNKLTCRINSIYPIGEIEKSNSFVQYEDDNLKTGCIKAFSDGSLGSVTAWFFEPYADEPDNSGLPTDNFASGELRRLALKLDKEKHQMAIHAIGDKAIYEIIQLYDEMSKVNPDWERRPRIEHVQHMRLEDIQQMKDLNIIASCQPLHLWADGPWCEEKIGKERLKGTYAFNSLIKAGVKVCFGSDWTVVPLNVIDGIYSAVTRFVEGNEEGEGWIPEEKISVREAVDCYTINAAYASFEEDKKGSIKAGKLADFVVLNKNIFEIPPEDINSAEVDLTIFDGKIIYKNN